MPILSPRKMVRFARSNRTAAPLRRRNSRSSSMNGFQHGGAILGDSGYPVVGVRTGIFMSEQLLEFLQVSLASHGMKADRSGAAVRAQEGLVIEPRVFPR